MCGSENSTGTLCNSVPYREVRTTMDIQSYMKFQHALAWPELEQNELILKYHIRSHWSTAVVICSLLKIRKWLLSLQSALIWDRHAHVLSCVWLSATLWTAACLLLLSMEFSRQGYWSGLPFPMPGDRPDPGTKPVSPASPAVAGRFLGIQYFNEVVAQKVD